MTRSLLISGQVARFDPLDKLYFVNPMFYKYKGTLVALWSERYAQSTEV